MSTAARSLEPARVFVVEDDAAVREALCLFVEGQGLPALPYADGQAFLEQAAPRSQDMVLLDLDLPGASGVEVASGLADRGLDPKIAVISALRSSAFGDAVDQIKPLAALRKPIELKDLLGVLDRV